MGEKKKALKPIVLTSHPTSSAHTPHPVVWGARDPRARGPIIGTLTNPEQRNSIGTHSGSYSVYRALAIASGALDPLHVPDLTNTAPPDKIGPFDNWFNPRTIVSLDPWGALVGEVFADLMPTYRDWETDRKSTRLNSSHLKLPRMPSSA